MSIEPNGPEYGRAIDEITLKNGLRKLAPGIHFDLGGATNQLHPYIEVRQGVFFEGKHICSMDRGFIPEFKLWSVRTQAVEVPWSDADKEDVAIAFERIFPGAEGYEDIAERARQGKDLHLAMHVDGSVIRQYPRAVRKVRGTCIRVGWRHTLCQLLAARIPGITRESLAKTFSIDMGALIVESPDEILAAVGEE